MEFSVRGTYLGDVSTSLEVKLSPRQDGITLQSEDYTWELGGSDIANLALMLATVMEVYNAKEAKTAV